MPNPFTYLAYDLVTMAPLDLLPYTNVTFGQKVNSPGSWTGQIDIADQRVQSIEYLKATSPGRTALFVDYLGEIVWGGIIWTQRYQQTTKILTVGAQEFGSYLQSRLQAADYSTTWEAGEDPMAIAQQVVEEALAKGQILGGLKIALSPASGSGQKVAVSYPGNQLQTIDSVLQTLSQMGFELGFDYGFTWEYVNGIPAVTLNLYYPRQGRTADQSGIVILGRNVWDYTYDLDSSKQANVISETGSGSGGIQPLEAEAENVIAAGYPRLEAAISHVQVNDEGVLGDIALGDLTLLSWPVTTPSLTLPIPQPNESGTLDPSLITFGQFGLGDDLIWQVDPVAGEGTNSDPRWPNGMSFEWRITGWTATVKESGVSTLLLDLGLPPVSSANVLAPAPPLM
ncbi:MAG TPA: hypothetical protein VGN13_12395 [Solirubrobacteraceae bacterium]|jgi:hypothetical protein